MYVYRVLIQMVLVFSLSVCNTVLAGKENMTPTKCQRIFSYSEPIRFMYEYGYIVNDSLTRMLNIQCPVDKTDFTGGIEGGWVKVTDNSISHSIGCALYVSTYYNSGVAYYRSSGYVSTSASGTGFNQYLNLGGIRPHDDEIGNYYLYCSIPPAASEYPYLRSYIKLIQIRQ